MKRNKKISQLLTASVASMLIMLLVLSPCKVRNSIESVLGVEKTTTSNKSKATLSTGSCVGFDEIHVLTEASKISIKTGLNPSAVPSSLSVDIPHPTIPSPFRDIKWDESAPPIPYYLLYKKFKAYLA